MKNNLVLTLKVVVTALLFFLLFRNIDFRQFWTVVGNARLHLLIIGFITLWIGHFACIFRWKTLMRPLMPVLTTGKLFGIYWIGLFFNLVFPTVVGGDVVKMYYAGKPSGLYAQSFAAIFLDRDAGLLAMMIIACAASSILPVEIPGIPVSLIVWLSIAAFVGVNLVLFTPSLHRLFNRLLSSWGMSGLAAKVDNFSNAVNTIRRHWFVLVASLVISLINQLIYISVAWFLSRGLGLEVSVLHLLVFIPIVTLVSMIPISLNGMGLREYALASLLGAVGVPQESAVALGLSISSLIILAAIPGGVVYLFFKNEADRQEIAVLETDYS